MARFFAVVLFALVACLTQDLSLGRPNTALDLATRFQDADNSGHLSVADIRPIANVVGSPVDGRFDSDNHLVHSIVGVGGPVYQSDDGRHTVGLGVSAGQTNAQWQGHNFRSKPSFGFGAGYRFRF